MCCWIWSKYAAPASGQRSLQWRDKHISMSNHGCYLWTNAFVVLYNMLHKSLITTSRKLTLFAKDVVTIDRKNTIINSWFSNHTKIWWDNMLKMFSVDVSSNHIVETVPECAFFAKIHRFLHSIFLSGSFKISFLSQHRSLWAPIIPPCWIGYVEYFNMRLQGSLVCSECAEWTVEQHFPVKEFPVYIAEVILVTRVVSGRKRALCAAKWFWTVFLKAKQKKEAVFRKCGDLCTRIQQKYGTWIKVYLCFRVWWIPCADIRTQSVLYKFFIWTELFELL